MMRLLRVPRAPRPPAGDEDVRVFQAAPELMIYSFAEWAMKNLAAGIGLWFGLKFVSVLPDDLPFDVTILFFSIPASFFLGIVKALESVAVITYVLQAIAGFILIRLDFENRWYMVSNRSLRIRQGLVHMREVTMTFANVQHVGIKQGPLQRLLGIADVEVRTAGGSSGSDVQKQKKHETHVAYFSGIKDAQMVSEVIRERLRLHRDAGLGDPDDAMPVAAQPGSRDLLDAARSLAEEARLLRAAIVPQA